MGEDFSVLYVGDDATRRERCARRLAETASLEVDTAGSANAIDAVAEGGFDGVVSEAALAETEGVALLRRVRDVDPAIPVVLFVEDGDEATAIAAIEADVTAYVRRDGEDAIDRLADTLMDAAAQYRAERDVAMLNELARNVYERITDAFFALDRDWRFTYLNEQAEELIGVDGESVVGENVWEVFPEAIGTTFYREYHRAMTVQEAVTFTEHFDPLDTTFEVRAYPSEDGLSVHFRDASTGDGRTEDAEHLVELADVLSTDILRSIEQARESLDAANDECDSAHLAEVERSLDRMEDLVTHGVTMVRDY